jgi:glycosyltransferase involved in cell wall biosynthesis
VSSSPGYSLALISDRVNADNGRAYWNERFLEFLTSRGERVLLVGDEETWARPVTGVDYVACPAPAAPELLPGVGPRPFIAFGAPGVEESTAARLAGAVDHLARHHRDAIEPRRFRSLDALADPSWLGPTRDRLRDLLAAARVRHLVCTTQSFLGYAATELARGGEVLAAYLIHSDYPRIFWSRLVAPLPPAERRPLRCLRDAMHMRMASVSLAPGSLVLVRSPETANLLELYRSSDQALVLEQIRPGIDGDRFAPAARDRAGPRDPIRCLVVSRLEADRGLERAVEIARLHRGSSWTFVGAGPLEAELRRAVPGARFPGWIPRRRLAEVYAAADVLVHTAAIDTFFDAGLEAMAAGLPVLAHHSGGHLSYLLNGYTGLVAGSAAEYARALDRLRDEDEYRDLSTNARRFAARMSWDRLCAGVRDRLGRYFASGG